MRAGPILAGCVVGILAGCGEASPPADLIPVPTQEPRGFQLGPSECPTALLEGMLVADDEVGFVVQDADGVVSSVVWPHGYAARDGAPRELLDGSGQILARAGDHVRAGGGFLAAGAVEGFSVCGDFEVVPAG